MTAPSTPGAATAQEADAAPVLTITVLGIPAPQGSKKGYVRGGRAVLVESSKKVAPWREAVKWATRRAMPMPDMVLAHNANVAMFDGPVEVIVTFRLPRPKYHFGTGRNAHLLKAAAPPYPAGVPDVDKTLRSTLDGLGESGLWRDDAQVVHADAWKVYADHEPPGATIVVRNAA